MLKKSSRLIIIALIFGLNSINLGGLINIKELEVKSIIESYFKLKYDSLSKLEYNKKMNELFLREKSKMDALDLLEIDIDWRNSKLIDYSFDKYSYELRYLNIRFENNQCRVELLEDHKIKYNFNENLEAISKDFLHNIRLIKENAKWYITDDEYEEEVMNEYNSLRSDNKEEFKLQFKEKSNDKKKKNIKIQYTAEDNMFPYRSEKEIREYNRNTAIAYARMYALENNMEYMNYEELGGDCTNFISQCLAAGGVPKDNIGQYKWYWYSDKNRWPSWTSAKEFRKYILNNNKDGNNDFGIEAKQDIYDNMEVGDIVQYIEPTHTMIITGYVFDEENSVKKKTDLLITQHSVDGNGRLKDYPLDLKPSTKGRFYIKINGYYN